MPKSKYCGKMKPDYFAIEYLLSAEVQKTCIENLKRVPGFSMFGNEMNQKAAVLIPLCCIDGQMSLLYTVRSSQLKTFSGQVSFPGGKVDPSDESLIDTALRETEEELGLSRSSIDVWGVGNYFTTLSKIGVFPVVGYIRNYDCETLRPNSDEVEEIFTLPLEHLCNPKNIETMSFRDDQYSLPAYLGGPEKIWGMTAFITHIFLQSLLPIDAYNFDFTVRPIASKM